MEIVLIVLGAACLIGAVVGGGVKVRQKDTEVHVPIVASLRRQAMLAALGVAFLLVGGYLQYDQRQLPERIMALTNPGITNPAINSAPLESPVLARPPRLIRNQTPEPEKEAPSDPLAGSWAAAADGSVIEFVKTAHGYSVAWEHDGFQDDGLATVDGDEVSLSLKHPVVGSHKGSLTLNGRQMSGNIELPLPGLGTTHVPYLFNRM